MALGQNFTKAGYKLISQNPANKPGNLSILTPKGSQTANPEFYQRLISEGVPITPGYIPEDLATKNPALKTQDYLAQQGLGGIYTSRLGQFDENQFNQEVSNAQIEQNLDANLAKTTGIQNPTTTDAQGNKVMTGIPNPATVDATPFTGGSQGGVQTVGGGTPQVGGQGSSQSKYQTGFQTALNAGVQTPTSGAQGASLVNQYAPQKSNTPGSQFVTQDPYMDSLVKTWQDYINPINQRASLADTYKQMVKTSGIEALDMELIDLGRIISGTESDIRREVTAASGFATDSQIRALADSRNEVLIKNYNNLLNTRNAKEKYLQTAIQLEEQDRQQADQKFEQSFNMLQQIADYGQKMQRNAIESLDRSRAAIGWTGILNSTQNDPYTIGLIEKNYGMAPGGLQMAAQNELRTQALAQKPIEVSPGATLFDPKTGKPIYTAPTTKQLGGGAIGGSGSSAFGDGLSEEAQAILSGTLRLEDLTPSIRGKIAGELTRAGYKSAPKLSTAQQEDLTSMKTVEQSIDQILSYNQDGKLEGIGFGTGPLGALGTKIFGAGSEEAKTVRALIGNIKGVIAKLRGGTSFTVNEQKLLDSYTPSINESSSSAINKLGLLKDFIKRSRGNLMEFSQERGVPQTEDRGSNLRSKYNY